MAQKLCESCSRTGLLSAFIAKDEVTNERFVAVEVCEGHTNPNLAIKSIEGIVAGSGLPVVILKN